MTKILYEEILDNISFQSLPNEWKKFDFLNFSNSKKLFKHQIDALEHLAKMLYLYYSNSFESNQDRNEYLKNELLKYGAVLDAQNILKYRRPVDKTRDRVYEDFSLLNNYFPSEENSRGETTISINNFLNRAAFWMATGSGKTYVIIKSIEYIDYLQSQGLIPKKDILLLLPTPSIVRQFQKDINEFNLGRDRPIMLSSLKQYEEEKNNWLKFNEIKVYHYRLDLLANERKENEIDYKDYENNGDWYVFLDEAHIGEKGNSKRQSYISILSRAGFLFNFSATFADDIDFITTCYNFNLKKLVSNKYGKNIYLSDSNFKFSNKKNELNELEKQKQILKSLIIFTVLNQEKKADYYHHPLMVTLVNTVNTEDSDLLMFFKKLEEFATNSIKISLFNEAVEELSLDFNNDDYIFNTNKLDTNYIKSQILQVTVNDVLRNIFNSDTYGKIEIINGEEGKELALKLETSDSPFALIRIGDSSKFSKEKLGKNYILTEKYSNSSYFEELNKRNEIKVLIGSRAFYQGWDTNRPNVMNFINIGTKDAERYVLQAIGRGIRIEPEKGIRKRKDSSDANKNQLLETLFIFATDKKGITSILDTLDKQNTNETPSIFDLDEKIFKIRNEDMPLLIPKYKNKSDNINRKYGKFNISRSSLKLLTSYFNLFNKNLFIIKYRVTENTFNILNYSINDNPKSLFIINDQVNYQKINSLMIEVIEHISTGHQELSQLNEIDSNDIRHYKYISLINLDSNEIKKLKNELKRVAMYPQNSLDHYTSLLKDGDINNDDFTNIITEEKFSVEKSKFQNNDDIEIVNLIEHFYAPLIYSNNEKVQHFRNIINIESEKNFVKSLINYIKINDLNNKWMFSKLVENIDNVFIPYFDKDNNRYNKYFPDFIFWVQSSPNDYKIIFVDPKGTAHSDYIQKIEGYKDIFENEKDESITFKFEDGKSKLSVSFELKMITDNINSVSDQFENYWLQKDDFSFLE